MFLVRMAESSQMLQEVLAPLSLASRDYIFMPINNNQDWTQVGGTHWSLLVFDRPAGVFRYYDSYGRMNERFARETARRLLPVLYPSQKQQQPVFLVERTPQQQNSADCGVFVLAITEALIAPFAKAAGSEESGAARQVCLTSSEDLNRLVSQATVDALRIRMRRLVEQLATANSSSSSSSSSSS
jgi:sentrin-specific protease 8